MSDTQASPRFEAAGTGGRDGLGDARPPLPTRRKRRNTKAPDATLIQSLEGLWHSKKEVYTELSAQHEELRAQHDALNAVVLSLEHLISATRPLRRAVAAAAAAAAGAAAGDGGGDGGAESGAAGSAQEEDWTELRELCSMLRAQPQPGAMPQGSAQRSCGDGAGGGGGGGGGDNDSGSAREGMADGESDDCGSADSAARRPAAAAGRAGGRNVAKAAGDDGSRPPPLPPLPPPRQQQQQQQQQQRRQLRQLRSEGGAEAAAGDGGDTPAQSGISANRTLPPGADGGSDADCDCGGGAGGGSGSSQPDADAPRWARYMGFERGAAAVFEEYRSTSASAAALRVQQYVHVCSVDLFQLRAGAPAAPAAARLQEQLDHLMAFSAILVVANPKVLGEAGTYRIDTCEPYHDGEPGREHWAFALRQAKLSRQQELSTARLVAIWKGRLAALLPRREALLLRQSECSADGDASAEVLADLERFQSEYVFTAMACANALWSCVMSPQQAAAVWAASYPYVPQLLVMGQGLDTILSEAEAEAAEGEAAAAAAGTAGATAARPRVRKPRGGGSGGAA